MVVVAESSVRGVSEFWWSSAWFVLAVGLTGCGGSTSAPEAGVTAGVAAGGSAGVDGAGAGGAAAGAGGAGTSGGAGAGQGGVAAGDSVFSAESEAISLHWSSFFGGSARYERQREELSAEELALAEQIRTVPSSGECWTDALEVEVSVTTRGVVAAYATNEFEGACNRDVVLVDYEPVEALVQQTGCLVSKLEASAELATAPHITPDDGCAHGLFNSTGTTAVWWLWLDLPVGSGRVALSDCGDRRFELTLYEDDGRTEVTASEATSAGECAELAYDAVAAQSHALRVELVSGTVAGDFFLRLDSD